MIWLLLGCGGGGTGGVAPFDLAQMSALDRAWTWRDDAEDTLPPDAAALLHGQGGEGGVELRRGERWEDAEPAGRLGLGLEGDLVLDGWSLDGAGEETRVVLVADGATDGDSVSTGSVTCTAARAEPFTTWYATFDPVMDVDCGEWMHLVFAEDFGLVWMRSGEVELDLVAPY